MTVSRTEVTYSPQSVGTRITSHALPDVMEGSVVVVDGGTAPDSPVSFDPNLSITVSTAVSDGLCGPNHPNVLAQRTISDDIQKIRLLGEGSFGKVYLGK